MPKNGVTNFKCSVDLSLLSYYVKKWSYVQNDLSKCYVDLSKRCLIMSKSSDIIYLCDVNLSTHCLILLKCSVIMSKCAVDLSKYCPIMSKRSVIIFLSDVDLFTHCLIMSKSSENVSSVVLTCLFIVLFCQEVVLSCSYVMLTCLYLVPLCLRYGVCLDKSISKLDIIMQMFNITIKRLDNSSPHKYMITLRLTK